MVCQNDFFVVVDAIGLLGIESRLFIGDNRSTKMFKVGPSLYEAAFSRALLSGEILARAGINIAKNTYAYAGVGGRLTRFKSQVTVNYEGDKSTNTKTSAKMQKNHKLKKRLPRNPSSTALTP